MTIAAASVEIGHVLGTTPYAWPWNSDLSIEGTAVLLIQAPGDSASSGFARTAALIVHELRSVGVLAIRVSTRTRRAPVEPGSHADLAVDLAAESAGVDGFYGSPLETLLRSRSIERLLLVGAFLETSVHSTMRTANDQGFECLLVIDACTPSDEGMTPQSVSMIEMSGGIFGAVGHAADVLAAFAPERTKR